jgi:hypothetical protein
MTSSSGALGAQMNGRRGLVLDVKMREMPENTYLIFPSVAPFTIGKFEKFR